MSRSGYDDDCGGWDLIRWRGAVTSGIRGKRGQAFLRELADAMDAMPEKRLIRNELRSADGEFCTLGVIGQKRGVDLSKADPYDRESVAAMFGISAAMAAEIVFENDEACWIWDETPEARWTRMRQWVEANISKTEA